ncbi:MAG TPA: sigma-70 family RNA polymerase sigma factor [Candidatus Saccharimonadales bacterium]|nr:sigma-70 family RNA polymerase sigma factor [Candidatus Saccharimonadales bacterium]
MALTESDGVEKEGIGPARTSVSLDDEAPLVAQAKAGQAMAWGKLFKRHEKKIYATASRIMRNHEDAEDVVQLSFQRAFMHLNSFHGDSKFSTWLTRIAINEALMMIRRRRLNTVPLGDSSRNETDSVELIEMKDSGPSPEQCYADLEQRTSLMSSVLRLRPTLRAVVLLRELRDLSTEETAKVLGISTAAAKTRLFHARAKLRESLQRADRVQKNSSEKFDAGYLWSSAQA